jgi:hypothetical protein
MPPLYLFYLLIIFTYEAILEIMLGFSTKNNYSRKHALGFSRAELAKQVERLGNFFCFAIV